MHGADSYIAVVVALLFVTGLIVVYWAVRQRSVDHRNWDGALVGTRAPSATGKNFGRTVPAKRV